MGDLVVSVTWVWRSHKKAVLSGALLIGLVIVFGLPVLVGQVGTLFVVSLFGEELMIARKRLIRQVPILQLTGIRHLVKLLSRSQVPAPVKLRLLLAINAYINKR